MKTFKKPTNVNIRNPLAIERIIEEVKGGRARNFSEAAYNLIVAGKSFPTAKPDRKRVASLTG